MTSAAVPDHGTRPIKLPLGQASSSHEPAVSPPARSVASPNSGSLSHRSSFAENLRSHPPSPRAQRHPSFTQAALQELMNSTPKRKGDPRFLGRDWRQICVGELVSRDDVRFVNSDTAVEDATKLLLEAGPPNVVLIKDSVKEMACDSFDYNDLNAYLLVVLGLASPDEDKVDAYTEIAKKAREGTKIPLGDISMLAKKAPLVTLPESQDLSKAVEIFAGGVHRILIVQEDQVVGILSQLKLVRFLWENGSSFPVIDQLYPIILRDLQIGTHHAIAINGDKPLTDALLLLNGEGLTSLAVVDNAQNVIGNISTVDVKHLTKTSSLPLLKSSCIHFISVILSERGVESGKDSYPVFHVSQFSTLAHTVAKLCATRAHRMWLTENPSPSQSLPETPAAVPVLLTSPFGSTPGSPSLAPAFPLVSAAAYPGANISGRLTGVVSLTDVLNLFARRSGLSPSDPNEQRQHRRRSSSSSIRPSFDSTSRSSIDLRR